MSIPPNLRNHNPKFCPSLQPIDPQFSEKILNLEIEVEMDNNIESVKKLLEIYSVNNKQQGIEYYEAMGDQRYQYLKERMNRILQQENIFKPLKPVKKMKITISSTREADKLLKAHESRSSSVSKELQTNVACQAAGLGNRLTVRRMRSISPLPPRIIEHYEDELEQTVERFVIEKLRRTQEVREMLQGKMSDGEVEEEIKRVQGEIESRKKCAVKKILDKAREEE